MWTVGYQPIAQPFSPPPLPAFALAEASVRTEHVSFSVLTALLICHVRLHAKMKHREILN